MSKVSKFIKVDTNVLLEYIYDDNNLISEPYKVLVNTETNVPELSFISGDTSPTINTQGNQLFEIDPIASRYGRVDETQYNFLQLKDFASGLPVRYDRIKVHLPTNYVFDEYFGFQIRVYTFDYDNRKTHDLTNFFFDISDSNQFSLMGFSSPPLLFQEKLWGKSIEVDLPSPFALSQQRFQGGAESNSINANLTNNVGLSQTSPIFIEFRFIRNIQTINSIKTYNLGNPKQVSLPQVPEFENLGVKIQESSQGDYFEIFGIFNDSIGEFKNFIDNSFTLGKRYYVEYKITVFEENIAGKSQVFTVTDDFNEEIEFRPIIKFSTTTAIIDVEMRLIDQVDNSQIVRRASYGMLQDQVAKYSLNLTKINIANATKPKIYNLKNTVQATNSFKGFNSGVQIEQVDVPVPVYIDREFIVAKSQNSVIQNQEFFGIGKLQIVVYPYDNVITFVVAREIATDQVDYFDFTSSGNIKMEFKSNTLSVISDLYNDTDEVDLSIGIISFKIDQNDIEDLRKISNTGINMFYITSQNQNEIKTVIYTGTFVMYDSVQNANRLNREAETAQQEAQGADPQIIQDPDINNSVEEQQRREVVARRLRTQINQPRLASLVRRLQNRRDQ